MKKSIILALSASVLALTGNIEASQKQAHPKAQQGGSQAEVTLSNKKILEDLTRLQTELGKQFDAIPSTTRTWGARDLNKKAKKAEDAPLLAEIKKLLEEVTAGIEAIKHLEAANQSVK